MPPRHAATLVGLAYAQLSLARTLQSPRFTPTRKGEVTQWATLPTPLQIPYWIEKPRFSVRAHRRLAAPT
jgi:hypothetical protein